MDTSRYGELTHMQIHEIQLSVISWILVKMEELETLVQYKIHEKNPNKIKEESVL